MTDSGREIISKTIKLLSTCVWGSEDLYEDIKDKLLAIYNQGVKDGKNENSQGN